jgi:hypothetical protein
MTKHVTRTSLVVAAMVTIGLAAALLLRDVTQGGSEPFRARQTPQDGQSSSADIELAVSGATFSAGSTQLELAVDAGGYASAKQIELKGVSAFVSSFVRGTIQPIGAPEGRLWLGRGGGEPVFHRFSEAPMGQPITVVLTEVVLRTASDEEVRVAGEWTLELAPPKDLRSALQKEDLHAAGAAADQGIALRVIGATRTTAETLVTVAVEHSNGEAGIDLLGEALLLVNGETFRGGIQETREEGSVLMFSFPPTPFGEEAQFVAGPWSLRRPGVSAFTDVDLTSVLAGVKKGQVLDVPGQVILSTDSPLISVKLAHLTYASAEVRTLQVTLRGNFQSAAESRFVAQLPNGEQVFAQHTNSSYRKDATGAVSYGTTEVDFPLGKVEDWQGVVRFFHGKTDEVIRGDWAITLRP